MLRLASRAVAFTRAALPEGMSGSVVYQGHASLPDGTLVLFGSEGTVLRLAPGQNPSPALRCLRG